MNDNRDVSMHTFFRLSIISPQKKKMNKRTVKFCSEEIACRDYLCETVKIITRPYLIRTHEHEYHIVKSDVIYKALHKQTVNLKINDYRVFNNSF